ncbi:hypothetical protein OIU77_021913 [Salix suchowensis]|uniref:Uncharacterized protein n=1 Tax=Salix suchowensis TaxID=1278906 RepID=A0ABQ9CFM3_9ROSI|nr:hypothetical protein OIU77_021913 [Salix suchowensis]
MGNLGETLLSFGFEGTGKFSSAGNFESVGEKFARLEIQSCAVLSLKVNHWLLLDSLRMGKWLGFAKGLMLAQGVLKWTLDDGNEIMGPSSSDISDCEVAMVAGLPASGKTTWADEYPEKLSVLLGRNLILDEMRIAVVAFPKPEDLEFRVDKRFKEMGMEVPADATNNMIARKCLFQMNFLIRIYISRFALWNSLLSTTSISGSISKGPRINFPAGMQQHSGGI